MENNMFAIVWEMKMIYKVYCEYYIKVDDTEDALDMARDFVNNEIIDGRFEETHLIIEESKLPKGEGVYNE